MGKMFVKQTSSLWLTFILYKCLTMLTKQTLCDKLVEKDLLTSALVAMKEPCDAAPAVDTTKTVVHDFAGAKADPVSDPHKGMSTEDLCLTFCIKEMETCNKANLQAMHPCIGVLELLNLKNNHLLQLFYKHLRADTLLLLLCLISVSI